MPRALEIPIEVTRLDRAQDSVRRLSSSIRGVGDASASSAERLTSSWTKAIERIGRQQERYLTVSGPAQRLERAQAARQAAIGAGDPARIFDAEAAVARATVGMQRARRQQALTGGGGFLGRFTGAFASTRFNMGGVSPLVGQSLEALGVPMIGATGAGLAGAAGAVAAFVGALHIATSTLGDFGAAMRLSGGTAGDVAGMGRFGFRGAEGAGAAATFRERIASDPMAMMFANRLGVRALPRPFGAVNEAALLNRAAEGLAKITNAEERLRTERVLGLEAAERYIDLSPRLRAVLDSQAKLEEQFGGGAKAANEYAIATETLQRQWQGLVAVMMSPAIVQLTELFERMSQAAAAVTGGYAGQIGGQIGLSFLRQVPGIGQIIDLLSPFMGGGGGAGGAPGAPGAGGGRIRGVIGPGQYGGAAGTMPGGWSGDYLARNMESGALSRGMPVQ